MDAVLTLTPIDTWQDNFTKKPRGRPRKGMVWKEGEGYVPLKKGPGRPPKGKKWVDGKGWVQE
jgi:hypothetical protein